MADGIVQVPPDSTGKRIRTIEVNAILPDGTIGVVEMQVVVQVDQAGNPIDPNQNAMLLTEIRDLLDELVTFHKLQSGI